MTKKRYLFWGLLLALLFLIPRQPVLAAEEGVVWGTDISWKLDDAGTLRFSGRGEISSAIYLSNKESVKKIEIQEGITTVGSGTFYAYTNVESVTLPASLKTIGDYAFYGCTALKNIQLPAGLERLGSSAFSACQMLETVNIPGNMSVIGANIFYGCGKLNNVTVQAGPRSCILEGSNLHYENYDTWSTPVGSYLYRDGSEFVRVEPYIGGYIVAERYNSQLLFQSGQVLGQDPGLLWGGFFAGQKYNFVVTGQENNEEDDNRMVLRVVKYSKQWQKLGQYDLCGANTTSPFRAGSLRMTESDGYLFIRTCHQMYTSEYDGYRHQSSLTLILNEDTMEPLAENSEVSNSGFFYVSHSFNQFIMMDRDKRLVAFDHGDAHPRSAVLLRLRPFDMINKEGGWNWLDWDRTIGANSTGATIGGLAETDLSYITALNDNGQGGGGAPSNVYLCYTRKSNFTEEGTTVINVSKLKANGTTSTATPQLVATGANTGVVLWEQTENGNYTDQVYFARYGTGGLSTSVQSAPGTLSDCQPIAVNSQVIWYVTEGSTPVFYKLRGNELIRQEARNGLYKHADGQHHLWIKGVEQKKYTGFYTSEKNGKVFYVVNGIWASGTTAVVKRAADNKWVYVKGGCFQKDFTGFYTSPKNGNVFYIVKGVWASGTNAVVKRSTDNKWVYVKGGYFQKNLTGFYTSPKNGNTFYLVKGVWSNDTTAVVKRTADNKWVYVKSGYFQKNFTGFYTSPKNGKVFYIVKGIWASGTNAVIKRPSDNKWVYVKGGYFQKDFSGFYTSPKNGNVFYIVKGEWSSGTTGVIKNPTDNKWVYVKGGYFQKDFTGIYASPQNGKYYVLKGVWQNSFSGQKTFNGITYTIRNGKVSGGK